MEYQSSIQTGQIIIGANFLVWGQLLTESESYFCLTEPKAQMSISHHMSINFPHLDLKNHRDKLDQTWVWYTLDGPLQNLCPVTLLYIQDGFHGFYWLNNWKSGKVFFKITSWNETKFGSNSPFQNCDDLFNYTRLPLQLIKHQWGFLHFLTPDLTNIMKLHLD